MKKRLLGILLLFVITLTLLPMTAFAEGEGGTSLGTAQTACIKCKKTTTFDMLEFIRSPIMAHDRVYHWVRGKCTECGNEQNFHPDGAIGEHSGGTETPTCTTGKTCEKCGEEYGILGHDWSEWQSSGDGKTHTRTCQREGCGAVDTANCGGDGTATCVTMGTCTDCGQQYYGGHTFPARWDWRSDTDVGRDAEKHWVWCLNCKEGKAYESTHSFSQGNMYLESAATCISKAVYYTNCGSCYYKGTDTYVDPYGQLNPNNHDGGTEVKNAKAATCTEKGYTGDTYCKGCGVKLADGTEVPALNHDWNTTYTWTQTGTGYTCTAKRVCKNDPAHVETETATAVYTVVTEPACLTAGVGRYQASFEADWAENASKDVSIPALDHDWGEWTSNGDDTHTRVCKRDERHTETVSCSGGTATCTEEATCADCGGKYGDKDPANHTGKEEWTITKTKHEKKWSCCGKVTVPEKSHTFGKWVVTKKATSRQEGEKTRTCEVCEYVEKATIQATGAPAKTGDDSHIGMWAGILCVSLAGIIALVVLYRKKHKK